MYKGAVYIVSKEEPFRINLWRQQDKYFTFCHDLTNVKFVSMLLHFCDACHITRKRTSFNCKRVTAFMSVNPQFTVLWTVTRGLFLSCSVSKGTYLLCFCVAMLCILNLGARLFFFFCLCHYFWSEKRIINYTCASTRTN